MKRVAAVIVGVVALLAAGGTQAAKAPARPAAKALPPGNSWASIAKLPDWRGAWDFDGRNSDGRTAEKWPLTPDAAARFKAFIDGQSRGEGLQNQTANCQPPGMPGVLTQPYPIEFTYTPGKIVMTIETHAQTRWIFLDGRPHPEDPDLTFNGHSIGHWEGDTLVIDTIGLLPQVLLAQGVKHSDKVRIVERMRLSKPDQLEDVLTITDPDVLTAPVVMARRYNRHRDWSLIEYVCEQNNRDSADDKGRAGMKID